MNKLYITKRIYAAGLCILCIIVSSFILASPQESFYAAISGLETWLRVVLPALFPFFAAAEVLIGIGVVDFIAVLLQPVMRPVFRCPGESSFIWAMSATSGYPAGARLTRIFLDKGKITVKEAQRIIAFSSTSGPLFMLSAVGIGMLNSPAAGRIIAISHYTASILLGILFRFYAPDDNKAFKYIYKPPSIKTALQVLMSARHKDGRTFGEILGDAVRNSMNTLIYIGGYIILFSVIIKTLQKSGFISILFNLTAPLLLPAGIEQSLLNGLIGGIFEMTTGCKLISQAAAPLFHKILLCTFIISWSGFSIHNQVLSFIGKTGVSAILYFVAKFFHAVLATAIAWLVIKIQPDTGLSVFHRFEHRPEPLWTSILWNSWQLAIHSILVLIITGMLVNLVICIIKLTAKSSSSQR
ncbi:MAG: sporulation integral membrane protein YlbJ [Clostridiales bacterium]|jgi:sporulation integral membrane protein YlbJ|nr:sporulation integral membrane protein YlbJ [Clostridiales bacterium]